MIDEIEATGQKGPNRLPQLASANSTNLFENLARAKDAQWIVGRMTNYWALNWEHWAPKSFYSIIDNLYKNWDYLYEYYPFSENKLFKVTIYPVGKVKDKEGKTPILIEAYYDLEHWEFCSYSIFEVPAWFDYALKKGEEIVISWWMSETDYSTKYIAAWKVISTEDKKELIEGTTIQEWTEMLVVKKVTKDPTIFAQRMEKYNNSITELLHITNTLKE